MQLPVEIVLPVHGKYEIDSSKRGLSLWKVTEGKRGRIPELSAPHMENIVAYLAASCNSTEKNIEGYFR